LRKLLNSLISEIFCFPAPSENLNMKKTIAITVKGKVQGVFYRQSTKEKARELGLTGVVRNLENGDVEIIASGESEKLNKLTEWSKTGPPKAVVSVIDVKEIPLREFSSFTIDR